MDKKPVCGHERGLVELHSKKPSDLFSHTLPSLPTPEGRPSINIAM